MNMRGLTLMEVIVAALILAITVGGVLYIFSTEKGTVAWTGRRVQAMDFGRQTLEALKNEVGADTWPDAGDLAEVTDKDVPLAPGEPSAFREKFTGTRSYTVENINADSAGDPVDYKSVTVTVDWEEPAEPE